jgi:uncharacterized protein (TIGR02466 family)
MANNLEQVNAFPGLIYKTHFDGELEGIASIALDLCKNQGKSYVLETGGKSTYNVINNAILRPECFELHEFVINSHYEVWNHWKLVNRPRFVHSSWFNWHPPGASTEEHEHSGVHLVCVVYLKNPAGGGNIQFKDPMQQIWASYPREDQLAFDWSTVEVKTGDVLFFPGFLRHRTEPNNSTEDRLVLTTNVCMDFFK